MKTQRVPAAPLITNDPYFSVWATADNLYDGPTKHWTGKVQRINGNISVDGKLYRFMGDEGSEDTLNQTGLAISATSTVYEFQGAGIVLTVTFLSPLLLDDMELVSRPCTYITFDIVSLDGREHTAEICIDFSQSHCQYAEEPQPMIGGAHECESYACVFMGKAKQSPLNHSGDMLSIDWGYLYLAVPAQYDSEMLMIDNTPAQITRRISQYTRSHDPEGYNSLLVTLDMGTVTNEKKSLYMVAAYDDISSINYFGDVKKGYWADDGETILEAIAKSISQYGSIASRCAALDRQIDGYARDIAGEEYAAICALAYRQTIAAHKLIKDNEGNPIFLSKECNSNGCIGTVDVSYPSIPLYLLYNTELVRGMMRPVFRFAQTDAWPYDYAPHDVGRYPYATGQVYGMNPLRHNDQEQRIDNGDVFPFFYQYPENSGIYAHKHQMPLEECGNMLIMSAITTLCDGDTRLAEQNIEVLEQWTRYLVEDGIDPGEQLCTDDFAGHLAHNANLSVKAIMGIAAFSIILEKLGLSEKSKSYLDTARQYAKAWEEKTSGADHTPLTFDHQESWGQKYNLVWDKIFGTNLFSDALFKNEIAYYQKMQNEYGLPLDNRSDYTKSDWILWCAALADDDADTASLIHPVYAFLQETPDRVPFSDWYFTSTAEHKGFLNRTVQGGLFMPICKKVFLDNKE